ncbi:MAG: ATP-dependent Clp protease adaptor ClpS [Phycisphaerales bacterium]
MSSTAMQTKPSAQTRRVQPPLWNVVLLDDDDHSYDYVIRIAKTVFAMPEERAFLTAKKVDDDGRVVLMTTHKEHAELKREQVLSFGRDPLIARCTGPMSCVIEPAEFEGDDSTEN